MLSITLTILSTLAAIYVIFGLLLFLMQPRLVYCPTRQISYTPAEVNLNFEDVYFRTGDKLLLHGWFVPAPGGKFTVLYCHGNGGNIMFYLDVVNLLIGLGLNCFIFDYRGYGQSQGRPSEAGTYLDAIAAFRWLTKIKKIPPEQIIIYGWSLGGPVAAYLATKTKPAGLVIEAAFTSYRDIAACYYPYLPVKWFAKFDYPTINFIRKVTCPVLIIHSREDEIIPFEMGLKLYDAANQLKDFAELQGGHNDAYLVSIEIYKNAWQKWLIFLDSINETIKTRIL